MFLVCGCHGALWVMATRLVQRKMEICPRKLFFFIVLWWCHQIGNICFGGLKPPSRSAEHLGGTKSLASNGPTNDLVSQFIFVATLNYCNLNIKAEQNLECLLYTLTNWYVHLRVFASLNQEEYGDTMALKNLNNLNASWYDRPITIPFPIQRIPTVFDHCLNPICLSFIHSISPPTRGQTLPMVCENIPSHGLWTSHLKVQMGMHHSGWKTL